MPLEWKDSYLLGEQLLDQQHQHLFALANAMLAATDQSQLRLSAMGLYQHVHEHFADEEALMKQVNYPNRQEHVDAHNRILNRLGAISQNIGKNRLDVGVVRSFLQDWGLEHIPNDDAQVARYIASRLAS